MIKKTIKQKSKEAKLLYEYSLLRGHTLVENQVKTHIAAQFKLCTGHELNVLTQNLLMDMYDVSLGETPKTIRELNAKFQPTA